MAPLTPHQSPGAPERRAVLRAALLQISIFVSFQAASYLSLLSQRDASISDFYLPTALSVILMNWISPAKVLPAMYLNAVVTSYAWGNPLEQFQLWFVFAIPETLFGYTSWLLFRKIFKGNAAIPDVQNLIRFLGWGILLPAILSSTLLQSMLVWLGNQSSDNFWSYVISNLLSEFATTLSLTLPILYFVSPILYRNGVIQSQQFVPEPSPTVLSRNQVIEIGIIYICILFSHIYFDFTTYWYLYGFLSLYVSIRFGFGAALSTNLFIILLTYIIPNFVTSLAGNRTETLIESMEVFLGANILFVFSVITGRVISDIRRAQKELQSQNTRLEQYVKDLQRSNQQLDAANKELDQFAYSVSHDLSAPLKTIMGLVSLSEIKDDPESNRDYLNKIGLSIRKLDSFISDVLEHTKNKRSTISPERIKLDVLISEIFDHIGLTSDFDIQIDLQPTEIVHDKNRIRIILINLLSNAVRFQKTHIAHQPTINISSSLSDGWLLIRIQDNGDGIRQDILPRVFDMFYRGSTKSQGAGLGLYIAQEMALRLQGNITLTSEAGVGTTATVALPLLDLQDELP